MRLQLAIAFLFAWVTAARAQAPVQTDAPPGASSSDPISGTARLGVYSDSDQTIVVRTMAAITKPLGAWTVDANVTIDAVSSASVDVRSSPLGAVDVVSSASGRSSTSGGQMSDTRIQVVTGAGWKDSDGHAANLTAAAATEHDYASVSAGLNGSYDLLRRNATLIGGVTITNNWISSVLDPTLHRTMYAIGWSAGAARVLTRDDAIRLRYDGKASIGYLASPYRNVRFGDWTATSSPTGQFMFSNTIGSPDGLPETVPDTRISHALTFEWVHWLAHGVGLHPAIRAGEDSWGVVSVAPSIDLRIARSRWRLQLGYRYYRQAAASFYESKYVNDPTTYTYYTSDKELGTEIGNVGSFDYAHVLRDVSTPNGSRLMFVAHADIIHYDYPGFVLLGSRDSTFAEVGVSWEQ